MLSLFLLAGLTVAMAGEPTRAPEDRPARRQVGDLAVEGTLVRLGLEGEPVRQVHAEWLPAMQAPTRSRSEGRELGWDFDVPRVWVVERDLSDGSTSKTEAAGSWRRASPCAALRDRPEVPMALQYVPPPIRATEDPLAMNERRRSLTVADTRDRSVFMVGLEPGESATIVEIEPVEGRRRSRRGRKDRLHSKLSIESEDAELAIREGEDGRQMCVDIRPTPPPAVPSERGPSLETQVRELLKRLESESAAGDDGIVEEDG